MDRQHEEFLFEFFGGFNPLRGATTGEGVKEFPWNFASAAPPRAVASRQRSRNSGGRRRLAAEMSGMTMVWELLSFGLKAIAGACVGRWTGQPRMPPQERQHEGL